METMSIKALAQAVLQRNRPGNQKETRSFLTGKIRKPEQQEGKLQSLRGIDQVAVSPSPQWQHDLCIAHADFNNWRGQCPVSLDDCLISKVIESGGNLDQLRGLNLGHGVTTDAVIDLWLETGEPAKDLINDPAWFVCMAVA